VWETPYFTIAGGTFVLGNATFVHNLGYETKNQQVAEYKEVTLDPQPFYFPFFKTLLLIPAKT
jgi:hypothetical protein